MSYHFQDWVIKRPSFPSWVSPALVRSPVWSVGSWLSYCELPCSQTYMTKNWGTPWTNSPTETRAFCPVPPKELNPAKSHMNDSEADLPPVKLSDESTAPKTAYLQPPKRPWTTGTQISCTQISNPQKLR